MVRKLLHTHAGPADSATIPAGFDRSVGPRIPLGRDLCSAFDLATGHEWLLTNGIGGFAAGTVSGACSRRYHGLLIAALAPPLRRTALVVKLEAAARYLGGDFPLSANEYAGGTIHPDGYRYLAGFAVAAGVPTWEFMLADARLTEQVWMAQGANTTYVRYRLAEASAPLTLTVSPLCTWRGYHGHTRGGWLPGTASVPGGVEIRAFEGAWPYRVLCPGAGFQARADWFWNFRHRIESERGLDDTEDLFCPGDFTIVLQPGESATLVCTAHDDPPRPAAESFAAEQARQAMLLEAVAAEPPWVRQLALAADQFIVRRGEPGAGGATVIAGYPWFGDWGRDTMIALPGLTLATGRPEVAARILRTFAAHISQGMLPNRFPDQGAALEYNTVDGTLWYFHAIDAYLRATGDESLVTELLPGLAEIIDWHVRGTRYGIGMDPADGLLRAGEPGVQLTWMDARFGDWVVTPRIGKPVEVNALWHHALRVMAAFATRRGNAVAARRYHMLAERAQASFRERFWCAARGYLYDVVDGPEGEGDAAGRRADPSLRPNQLFAVSLPSLLLPAGQARAVVEVCARELLTPVGLRSLAAGDPRYVGGYGGGPRDRDGAYHQGTVWAWLLGPFAVAHYRVHGDAVRARAWLEGIGGHLAEACVGNVSEIFDGDPPHRPRGCPAQAWSVAEILRAWLELGQRAA